MLEILKYIFVLITTKMYEMIHVLIVVIIIL